MTNFFHSLASPKHFYRIAGKFIAPLWVACLLLFAYGITTGLVFAPPDYQQGDAYRIIYIHVPCAVLSLLVFVWMTIAASIYLIWRIKLADVIAKVSAPIGACFTLLALITGSLWGKPMWGTWWIWDARLTSELLLLFLYLGIIALRSAINQTDRSARACAILSLVGLVDIPVIHYSVNWWNTLHQKATLLQFAKPTLPGSMLYPLLAMLSAFFLYYLALVLMCAQRELIQRELQAEWVKYSLSAKKP